MARRSWRRSTRRAHVPTDEAGSTPHRESPAAFVTRGRRPVLAALAVSGFLGGLFEAAFLVGVSRIAFTLIDGDDQVNLAGSIDVSLTGALVLSVGLVLVRLGLAAVTAWLGASVSSKVLSSTRSELNNAFLDASWEVQQEQSAGGLQEISSNYGSQASGLIGAIAGVIGSAVQLAAMLGIAVLVDPLGALILVVTVGVLAMLLRPLRALIRRLSVRLNSANVAYATSANEASRLGLELHIFHVQGAVKAGLESLNREVEERNRALYVVQGLVAPAYAAVAYMAMLATLAVIVMFDVTDVATLGAVVLVMLRSLSYGQALQIAYTNVDRMAPTVAELLSVRDHFRANRRGDGGAHVGNVGAVTFERVTFAYEQDNNVVKNISFEIQPREIVGIVGPSGGGKSTMVQLLLGLRDPQKGMIRAEGRDISTFSRSEWARKVTFVPQAAHLVNGTIRDNIRFFRDEVSDDDIERAARLAHLDDDIAAMPGGYERSVGEGGGHLSGGQQQRLCIARALVEAPDVLVLDEPTSALDVRSEHLVRTTLLGLKDRMTVVVIAHRLSTLDICDRIMVIQDGELVGFDSPRALESSNEFYREALLLSGLR